MARTRSVDFLPEIFRTDTNRQFLAATLDQLIQEPRFRKTQGFIGRTVGPGVNPNDRYVVEPDKTRADYQLEPGVVSLDPEDTNRIQDVITFPGMADAISSQGGPGNRPDRLYEADYYTWDPFCDFDAFVNFSQYYWLPNGPDAVDVAATGIPASDNFVVTRANGVYTFSGVAGSNPNLQLLRGGSYTFTVAQNAKETVNYRVSNSGTAAYLIDGQPDPTLTLVRGNTYVFNITLRGIFPFWIKTAETLGTDDAYNDGVSRNGSSSGLITFVVPQDAPDTLYYVSENQTNMRGVLQIIDGTSGTGPGFWIQTSPGVDGVVPSTPNISNRQILGVTNNGEDLGVVQFNVPQKTAQQFFYDLSVLATPVDLITGLRFDQINNQPLAAFLAQHGGIDGLSSLNGRTLVFATTDIDADNGGWFETTFFDPLPRNDSFNGEIGSFDTTTFDQTTEVPLAQRRSVWQISVITLDGIQYLSLASIADIPNLNKFTVRYGNQYSNTSWYKTTIDTFSQIPLLTATLDTLYYQDGTDPCIVGEIQIRDDVDASTLFIDDILGQTSYTSPNGVIFTNGLKVVFRGDVVPASYGSGTLEFTCTASNAEFNTLSTASTANLYVGQELRFLSPTIGGLEANVDYYVQSIVNSFQFTVAAVPGGGAVSLQSGTGNMDTLAINYREFYVAGVGEAIQLLPARDFVTPESYVVDAFDSTIATEPDEPDYITIDRASQDLNAWTRSNRWFHLDVITATAQYNNTVPDPDVRYKARRPIIQFRPDIRLYNMGTSGKSPVDVIDFQETDAFSNVQGALSYSVQGYSFVNGTRVIFAQDEDPEVRNKIYVVEFITPDTVPPLVAQPFINLTQAPDGAVLTDQSTVILYGSQSAGKTYWYDGSEWALAQQKTSVQQAPLFDVYDSTGVSFGNQIKYPSTDFVGSKLFSYAIGDSGILDEVLKFPLRYLSIANVGDIVFDNNLYSDTFTFTRDNVSTVADISDGTPREYASRTQFQRLLGWQNAITTTQDYQQFKFIYNGEPLALDISVLPQAAVPVLKIYVGSQFQDPSRYSYVTTDQSTTITFNTVYEPGVIIEVLALSDQTSAVAFYQVPVNLENNPLNENSQTFTLGTIRQHYQSLCENLPNITGNIIGQNNTRDLGNIVPYGLTILQQSAPLTLAGYFLRSEQYNIFTALQYNAREYSKYKNQLMEAVTQQVIQFETAAQILDTAVENITAGRVETSPFYWSDMLPSGAVYTETVYTVSFTTGQVFDTIQVYNYASANYLGMNVYLNNNILLRDTDYTVATDGPRITVLVPLSVGDTIAVREYASTVGNFVPNSPTKIGAYPAYQPQITEQVTSTGTQQVIIGHDGSVTPLFGDIRDEVLLEFERRIYNNLKLDGNPVPLTQYDVLPGQFRDTGYSSEEINTILETEFLSYVAANKLDYQEQDYNVNNAFTYNYNRATNKLNNETLPGAWRGIYRYFYDTQQPEYTPWEMLGFSIKPIWWDETYGTAPYTDGNLVLWDDLEAGYVRDPIAPYFAPEFARPGLTQVIPTGSQGQLLPPLDSVVGNYDSQQFRRSWSPGDGGPVEASWWNSSFYPFAVMRLLALTRPAKFFALFADRDLYRYQAEFDQYLYDDRYRLDANGIEVYGDGVSKASYINWIVDFNRTTGLNSTQRLTADLRNLDVRLCYRMASFSDKQYIKIFTEKATPDSTNTSFLIPDSSYNLLLYKNQPFARASYSSVLIQQVPGGYAVFGYSNTQPYFVVQQSQTSGRLRTISIVGTSVRVPTAYTDFTTNVPYGFVFSNRNSVADFLLSYGEYLERQGLTFANVDNGYELNWNQMVNEFLYWSQQGWSDNAILALNPLAGKLTVTRERAVVDSIQTQTFENILLDQNRRELPSRNLNIVRIDNTFTVEPLVDQSLSFIDLRYTAYEHLIVMDNRSEFGDLIYDPITGARQSRLNLVATTTADWNGAVDAQGFILNQDNVQPWNGDRIYSKGEIVIYKGTYWSAATIVQPSARFNYNDWIQSDYEQIELGLLPNLANKADQLANTYSINRANLESDNDLFAFGLIGFRPRQYLAALDLDDISQVNIYRQFLATKGTRLATDLFRQADLAKEIADYEIFENWAVQRAVYGANANRSFFELRLNRALLSANPSVIQVINPGQTSDADQTILLGNVWRQSFKLQSPDILPETRDVPTDTALPSAGYVNLDDVDITVFDLDDPADLEANLNSIGVGTSIWVAKVNDYDWNIYRAQAVPGYISHVCDNLDLTSLVIFTQQHGLSVNDRIIIRFFDTEVDGVYDVLSVPSLDKITIAFQFSGSRSVANGVGLGFTLKTMRVSQFADVVNLPYANDLTLGSKIWVDDDGTGHWAVLEKREVFDAVTEISPQSLDATEAYGSAVAQATNRFAALVGSPRYGFGTGPAKGAVYTYVKNFSDSYQPISPVDGGDALLTLDNSGTRGYGTSVDFGNQDWAVAGAPGSLGSAAQINNGYACVIYRDTQSYLPGTNPYFNWQLLTTPDSVSTDQGEFGYSVAMSLDERWLYVGAPGVNRVYAYGQVDWQNQRVRRIGDGVTRQYAIRDTIQIDADTQVAVSLDGVRQVLNQDYVIDPSFSVITFVTAPLVGTAVDISRISLQNLDAQTYLAVPSTGGTGTGATFTVQRRRGEVEVFVQQGGVGYGTGNTITIAAADFDGGTSPANDITFSVVAVGVGGDIISISTPAYAAPALATVFDLGQYFFQVNLASSTIASFSIEVDSVLARPNIDYTFDTNTKEITFINSPATGSSILARAKGFYQYVDTLTISGMSVSSSSTTLTVALGAQALTVATALGYTVGQTMQIAYDDNNTMSGVVTAYNGATGALSVFVGTVQGSGTYSSWTVRPLDRFGHTVSTTTDGRQVIVGAPNRVVNGEVQAGAAYVFDRNTQKFIYGQDSSTVVFTTLGTAVEPIAVSVNGAYLDNQDTVVIDAPGSFVVDPVDANIVTVNTDLSVGDVVEIETNQFRLIQTLSQPVPAEFSNFAQASELCPFDCSLYVGAPQSSLQIFKGGVVERAVNQSRLYGTITSLNANASLTPGNTLRVNNQDVAVPVIPPGSTAVQALADEITQQVPNVTATVQDGLLRLAVANEASAVPTNKLQVAPGSVGSAFDDLGFNVYVQAQTIQSPYPQALAQFGFSLSVSEAATELAVGVPKGTMYLLAVFDGSDTEWDAGATIFFSEIPESGTVYVYDFAAAAAPSASNPGNFVIGQQIAISDSLSFDQIGIAVNYTSGVLWIGSPGSDVGDSSSSDYGRVYVFENENRQSAWVPLYVQPPTVDIRLLNSVFLYDQITSATTEFLDFFNPLQGKILGAARQNIDFIGATDPASYNAGPVRVSGTTWGASHVGEVWWDTSTVRFIDPNQDTIIYTARRWGQVFPGSQVDVYQWVVSDQPPANYTGPGTPYNSVNYTINSVLGDDGVFSTQYFFWVRGLTTVATSKGKTLSVDTVSRYIENPRATGIAYLAPINASTVAIYNCETLLEAQDTILHIEFDRQFTTDNVHVEYELIAQGRPDAFLSDNLYRKLQDSLCGVDTAGNLVPDIFLSPPERYGVQFRPRQSMFIDRFEALRNYIDRANEVLARFPIAEIRLFNLLNSQEPEPGADSGLWNMKVANLEILSFQNIDAVPLGYAYLVESDASQRGLWTIYTVTAAPALLGQRELLLTRVQNFNTRDYWSYIDWYQPGYNSSIKPVLEVPNFSSLSTITVPVGSSVKVTANSQGKFEIYLLTDAGFERVGLEDGTIEISSELYDYAQGRFGFDVEVFDAQYFDQEPVIETRKIIQAINEELFVDDLVIERNQLLTLMFNYALTEVSAPEWLTKTSLIDVDHRIRELLPFQNYRRDNQEFVLDYIQEVKPYHVQIREFNLQYFGSNDWPGDITDFDVPAYFNTALTVPQFTSPILLPYEAGTAQVSNTLSDAAASAAIWTTWPWSQWFGNYLARIDTIEVTDGGSGYTEAPQVTIVGDATTATTAVALINTAGAVTAVNVITDGSGYRDAPTVVFSGGNGSGAQAYARLIGQGLAQNYSTDQPTVLDQPYNLVRSFRTVIRYDRYQYQTSVLTWSPEGTYLNGTLVRYDDRVWEADSSDGSSAVVGPTFDLENWRLVNPASYQYPGSPQPTGLTGIDRTQGLYVAGVNQPGLDLPLLIDGISYPGVQVWGDYFLGTEQLDAQYSSSFTDLFLGARPTDINVDGGAFVGPYEGHAPEELVNGSEFDTLDLRVFTRPGSDWQRDGHGFQIATVNTFYNSVNNPQLSWADLATYPAQVLVSNQTTRTDMTLNLDYVIDWETQVVIPVPGGNINNDDLINITVYELGGGSQLYRDVYLGQDIADARIFVPVNAAEIEQIVVFVDGELWPPLPIYQPYIDSVPWNILNSYAFNTVVEQSGSYYRALQAVPVGVDIADTAYWLNFVPTLETEVDLVVQPDPGASVTVVVLGFTTVQAGDFVAGREYTITTAGNTAWTAIGAASNAVGTVFTATGTGTAGTSGLAITDYSWSTPVTQTVVADVNTVAAFGFPLINSMSGTNAVNMIVTRNGLRLAPPAGIEWIGDGTTSSFGLPQRLGSSFLQSTINAITDIQVWVDNIPQTQAFGSQSGDFSVTNWDGSNVPGRQVVFNTPPVEGAQILITVSTLAAYSVIGSDLVVVNQPNLGDVFVVTSFNDTSQQDLLTTVFVGPVVTGSVITEPYDSTNFDDGTVNFAPGSFDFSTAGSSSSNNFVLSRPDVTGNRLWVTLDGARLFEGQDFSVQGQTIVLASGTIGSSQILAVTEFTESVVPNAAAFRVFQDMRGVQATYRITPETSTVLAQNLAVTDDVIHVAAAANLTEPDLVAGIFGVITIDGERITYRARDVINNTVSGLRRGTAGTAIASHTAGAAVYDIGRGQLLAEQYQDYVVSDTALADGSTTVYYAPNISITDFGDSSSIYVESIEVYVGGVRQYNYADPTVTSQYPWIVTDAGGANTPLTIEFITSDDPVDPDPAPPAGVQVTILQRRGTWWYDVSTAATRELSLQESLTVPARFLTNR